MGIRKRTEVSCALLKPRVLPVSASLKWITGLEVGELLVTSRSSASVERAVKEKACRVVCVSTEVVTDLLLMEVESAAQAALPAVG